MPNFQRIAAPGALTYTPIDIALATTNTIVTPSSGKYLHVVKLLLVPASSVVVTPKMGSTNQTGAMTLAAALQLAGFDIGGDVPATFYPLWSGGVGEAFALLLGSAVQVSGGVWTIETSP